MRLMQSTGFLDFVFEGYDFLAGCLIKHFVLILWLYPPQLS